MNTATRFWRWLVPPRPDTDAMIDAAIAQAFAPLHRQMARAEEAVVKLEDATAELDRTRLRLEKYV